MNVSTQQSRLERSLSNSDDRVHFTSTCSSTGRLDRTGHIAETDGAFVGPINTGQIEGWVLISNNVTCFVIRLLVNLSKIAQLSFKD